MNRSASARWIGGLQDGGGTFSTDSGVLKGVPYSFPTRFQDDPGTNPEELVAAAHAGCFSMALASALGNAGFSPENIETTATLHFEKTEAGWSTTSIDLAVVAKVPGATNEAFQKAAEGAKEGCPISRLLDTTITLTAELL
ncbi:MAG: OsmC family protein [Thermoplasmata archaeon]|jgi:osmotically inducible protein OsmC